MRRIPALILTVLVGVLGRLTTTMVVGAEDHQIPAQTDGQATAVEPQRLLSIDTWFTYGALASYRLIHDANRPQPVVVASIGLPELRAVLADGWEKHIGINLIEKAQTASPDNSEELKSFRKGFCDSDTLLRFLQKKPDTVVLTVQMLGPVNTREVADKTVKKRYRSCWKRSGATTRFASVRA